VTARPLDDPRLVAALGRRPGWDGPATAERIGTEFGFGGASWLLTDRSGTRLVVKVEEAARTGRALAALGAVGEALDGNVPVVLDGWVDEDADRGVILFEHIAPAVQGDVLRATSLPQSEALVDVMADLHGLAVPDALDAFEVTRWEPERWLDRVEGASSRFPDLVEPHRGWLLGEFPVSLAGARDRMEASEPVLMHGDLHLDNVLWRPAVTPVVLDWSNAGAGPASRDLLVLVGGGIPDGHRSGMVDRYAAATARRAEAVVADLLDAAHWMLRGVVGWAAAAERVEPGTRLAATCRHGLTSLFEYLRG
jgi:aminoglycoside phosphotransferase (APT) family kinase protein